MRTLLAVILFVSLMSAANAELPFLLHQYTITPNTSLTRLQVQACFTGIMPRQLVAGNWRAAAALRRPQAVIDGQRVQLQTRGARLLIPHTPDNRCIDYAVDIARLVKIAPSFNSGLRTDTAVLMANSLWLWRPAWLDSASAINLHFKLPNNMQISAPWQTIPSATKTFRLANTPTTWPGAIVLGDLQRKSFSVHNTRYNVTLLDGPARTKMQTIMPWLQRAARAVTHLNNGLPANKVQIIIAPHNAGNTVAPFATTARGGGAAVHMAFNIRADKAQLKNDTIATHELLHLYLPFVDRRDAWLPEGFASYYQHIVRARAGQVSAREAWRQLHAGLLRGNYNTDNSLTLRDASACMLRCGQTPRVYWSGAALWLLADVALRAQSNNHQTLDTVLAQFAACCRYPDKRWRADDLFARLDALSGTTIFSNVYEKTVDSRFYPRLGETRRKLGLQILDNELQFNDIAPLARLRRAIMQPQARISEKLPTPDTKQAGATPGLLKNL